MNVLLLFVWQCIETQSQVCFIDIDFLKRTTSRFSKTFNFFEWLVLHAITKLAFYLKLLFYNRNSPYLDILCRTCNEIWNYYRFFFTVIIFLSKHDFNKLALGVSSTLLLLYRNFKWITFPNSSWKQTEENVM